MVIPPVDSSVIAALRLEQVAAANADANAVAPSVTITVNGADASASIVEFSPLAHLLAVTVLFQTPQTGSGATGKNLNFQQLAQAASDFVDAFNTFQNTINASNATPFESAFDSALLNALQNQNVQSGSASVQSFIDSLAQVGINFQGANDQVNPNQFQYDVSALQAAYNLNAAQTTGLLTNAFAALNSIEAQLMLTQATQPPDVNQTGNNAGADRAAKAPTGNVSPTAVALPVPAVAPANTQSEVSAAATVANAFASVAVVNPPATAVATTVATPQAAMNPAIIDPIVALAVAAYRVTENLDHTPVNQPSHQIDATVPDIIETDRIEPIGPNTPRTPVPTPRTKPGH